LPEQPVNPGAQVRKGPSDRPEKSIGTGRIGFLRIEALAAVGVMVLAGPSGSGNDRPTRRAEANGELRCDNPGRLEGRPGRWI